MSKKSKTTTGPSKFAQPFISSAANQLQSSFQGNEANTQKLSGVLNDNLQSVVSNTFNNPTLGAANGYTQDVLGGKYLSGNPYLDSIIGQTSNDVTNRVEGSLGTRGRTGGDAHSAILGKQLAESENALRYNDYSAERTRMGGAVNDAAGLSSAGNQGIAALLAYLQTSQELPTSNATGYADSIAKLMGNYNTTTQKASTAQLLAQMAGNAASAYAGGGG